MTIVVDAIGGANTHDGRIGQVMVAEPEPVLTTRLALNVAEACGALGVSHDFWAEHIAPDVRIVRRGRRKLIAVAELERWLAESAERARDGL